MTKWLQSLALFGVAALLPAPISAQQNTIPDFYRGKTVSILVGYEAGGGYDLYARLIGPILAKHIPGQPNVVVQNMPGAGGLRAARNLSTSAPKDGTVLAMLAQSLPFDSALGYTPDIDAINFIWLGRVAMNVEVGIAFKQSNLNNIDDLRRSTVPIGGTGGTASSTVIPFLLNQLAGTQFKLISGYKSANEVLLAMERREVDMVGATGISTVLAKHERELNDGSMRLLYQNALSRHPLLPTTPTIGELGTNPENKMILDLFAAGASVGRTLVAPPGTANEKAAILRQAMTNALADPELFALAKKQGLILEPGSAAEITSIVESVSRAPKPVTERARSVLESLSSAK
ncbi:MAG: tripartite tricarboxylate transporter substrate-binding protein [Actinomycetes bacterium]